MRSLSKGRHRELQVVWPDEILDVAGGASAKRIVHLLLPLPLFLLFLDLEDLLLELVVHLLDFSICHLLQVDELTLVFVVFV